MENKMGKIRPGIIGWEGMGLFTKNLWNSDTETYGGGKYSPLMVFSLLLPFF